MQLVKGVHGWQIGQESLAVVVPELHVWVVEEPLYDAAGHCCGLVAGAEKEGDERVDHFVAEAAAEHEDTQHGRDGHDAEHGEGVLDCFQEEAEFANVGRVFL